MRSPSVPMTAAEAGGEDAMAANRTALADFVAATDALAVGDRVWDPSAIVATVIGPLPPSDPAPPTAEWPLATTPSTDGDFPCTLVEGPDAATLATALAPANELTGWIIDGVAYSMAFRPLVPGDPLRDAAYAYLHALSGTTPAVVEREDPMAMELCSPVFADGERIPDRFARDGANVPPPLRWTGVAQGTAELAIEVTDPDAPKGTFVHWIVAGLDPALEGWDDDRRPPARKVATAGEKWATAGLGLRSATAASLRVHALALAGPVAWRQGPATSTSSTRDGARSSPTRRWWAGTHADALDRSRRHRRGSRWHSARWWSSVRRASSAKPRCATTPNSPIRVCSASRGAHRWASTRPGWRSICATAIGAARCSAR
jgi:hypothetical protein